MLIVLNIGRSFFNSYLKNQEIFVCLFCVLSFCQVPSFLFRNNTALSYTENGQILVYENLLMLNTK